MTEAAFVCAYAYDDEDGFRIGEHVRWRLANGGKTFSYRHGSPGRYVKGKPKGMDDLLYRLPELLRHKEAWHGPQAVEGDDWYRGIWWAEGEKDADALIEVGVFATSHHGGATKVTPAQCEWLRGYEGFVTVVADNDEGAGAADALARLSGLYEVGLPGARVRIVHAASGKDAHDHIAAGHAVADFVEVEVASLRLRAEAFRPEADRSGYDWTGLEEWRANVRVAPSESSSAEPVGPQPVDWKEFWSTEPEPIRYLVSPFVAASEITRIYAQAKVGKSLLGQELAAALATGAKVLGEEVEQQTSSTSIKRTRTTTGELASPTWGTAPTQTCLGCSGSRCSRGRPSTRPRVGGRCCRRCGSTIRPSSSSTRKASSLEGDEDKAPTSAAFYRHSLLPLKRLGIAVLILDHAGNDPSKPRGSSGKRDDVDVVWQLKVVGSALHAHRSHQRKRHEVSDVHIVREDGPLRHVIVDVADLAADLATQRCLTNLRKLEPPPHVGESPRSVTVRLKAARLGIRESTVRQALPLFWGGKPPNERVPSASRRYPERPHPDRVRSASRRVPFRSDAHPGPTNGERVPSLPPL